MYSIKASSICILTKNLPEISELLASKVTSPKFIPVIGPSPSASSVIVSGVPTISKTLHLASVSSTGIEDPCCFFCFK